MIGNDKMGMLRWTKTSFVRVVLVQLILGRDVVEKSN